MVPYSIWDFIAIDQRSSPTNITEKESLLLVPASMPRHFSRRAPASLKVSTMPLLNKSTSPEGRDGSERFVKTLGARASPQHEVEIVRRLHAAASLGTKARAQANNDVRERNSARRMTEY